MTTYSASHIANFFLEKAREEDIHLTQMKLMKLVYIGYGWVYATLDRKLFEEPIQAWKHGPVVRSIYDEFKHNGSNPIQEMAVEFDLDKMTLSTPKIPTDDQDVILVLNKVWAVYKQFSASSLRQKTHEAGTPWKEACSADGYSSPLDNNKIKSHFVGKITSYLSA